MSINAKEIAGEAEKTINEFVSRGFHSLGLRVQIKENEWQFLGVLPLFDPPRDDAKTTIETAGEMDVKIKIVIGDQVAISKETAKKLGLGTNILDASILSDDTLQESKQVSESIENAGLCSSIPRT